MMTAVLALLWPALGEAAPPDERSSTTELPAPQLPAPRDRPWTLDDGTQVGTTDIVELRPHERTPQVRLAPPDGSGLIALAAPVAAGIIGACTASLLYIGREGLGTEGADYGAYDSAVNPETIVASVGVGVACAALPLALPAAGVTLQRRHRRWLDVHEFDAEPQGSGLLVGGATALVSSLAALSSGALLLVGERPAPGWALVGVGTGAMVASVPLFIHGTQRRSAYLRRGGWRPRPKVRESFAEPELGAQLGPIVSPSSTRGIAGPPQVTGLSIGLRGRF